MMQNNNQEKDSRKVAGKHVNYVAVVILIILTVVVILRAAELWGRSHWSAWVGEVQIASQLGTDKITVITLLGEPSSVQTEYKPMLGIIPPPPSHVEGTREVLVYTRSFLAKGKGFYVAYIYLGEDDKVIAYHIATS